MLRLVSQWPGCFLSFICLPLLFKLFFFKKEKRIHFIVFSVGDKWPPLSNNSAFLLLYESALFFFYFLIIYFVNSTGLFLCKRTNSHPRWPHFLPNRRLPFHVVSSGQRRWIRMGACCRTMQEKCFCLAVVIATSYPRTAVCTSENQVAVFNSVWGGTEVANILQGVCSAPGWVGTRGLCRGVFVYLCV